MESVLPTDRTIRLHHIKEILQDANMVTKLNERFQKARGTYKEAWGQALETKSLKAMYEVETVK